MMEGHYDGRVSQGVILMERCLVMEVCPMIEGHHILLHYLYALSINNHYSLLNEKNTTTCVFGVQQCHKATQHCEWGQCILLQNVNIHSQCLHWAYAPIMLVSQ